MIAGRAARQMDAWQRGARPCRGRSRPPERVEQHVHFARRGEQERELEPPLVGQPALHDHQGTPGDRHDEQSRTFLSEGAKPPDPQREDRGEHDRVEEADQDQRPHRCRTGGKGRNQHHRERADRKDRQHMSGVEPLHQRASGEAPGHHAAPEEGEVMARPAHASDSRYRAG
ncbi:hypothetical protein DdX_21717 [Ditylenchus destructor]|uniref:Uncharacterized protein n=1 Tax=Ditylenchus destructor TaxID=166010 RepID=A0AAD4MEH5_9BILA|nr:hypothetical protein DdX_21717 [Ditylenchus destructor]